jgi:hypothetical protein
MSSTSYHQAGKNTPSSVTGYGESRVSERVTIFRSHSSIADVTALNWAHITTGGATITHNATEAAMLLNVPNTTVSKATRRTKRMWQWFPSETHRCMISTNFQSGTTGTIQKVGMWHTNTGLWLQYVDNGGTDEFYIVQRTLSGDQLIDQVDWTHDHMLGAGMSAYTLAAGDIVGVEFDIVFTGAWWYYRLHLFVGTQRMIAHEGGFECTGRPAMYLQTEVENPGTGAACALPVYGCVLDNEAGGNVRVGMDYAIGIPSTGLLSVTTNDCIQIIAMRLRPGYEHASVVLSSLGAYCLSGSSFKAGFVLNPTIISGAYTNWQNEGECLEFDVQSKVVINPVRSIWQSFLDASVALVSESFRNMNLPLGRNGSNVEDILVFYIQKLNVGNENYAASIAVQTYF